jgi:hypothetical protein
LLLSEQAHFLEKIKEKLSEIEGKLLRHDEDPSKLRVSEYLIHQGGDILAGDVDYRG